MLSVWFRDPNCRNVNFIGKVVFLAGGFFQVRTFKFRRHDMVNNCQKLTEPDFLGKFSFGPILLK